MAPRPLRSQVQKRSAVSRSAVSTVDATVGWPSVPVTVGVNGNYRRLVSTLARTHLRPRMFWKDLTIEGAEGIEENSTFFVRCARTSAFFLEGGRGTLELIKGLPGTSRGVASVPCL